MKMLLVFVAVITTSAITFGQNQAIDSHLKKEHHLIHKAGKELVPVSAEAQNAFYAQFGAIPNVSFRHGAMFDEAYFTKDSIPTIAYFDLSGNFVGTTCMKSVSDLPEIAVKQIQKHYKDWTIEKIVFYNDNENITTNFVYEDMPFANEDMYFAEIVRHGHRLLLLITQDGDVSFFKEMY